MIRPAHTKTHCGNAETRWSGAYAPPMTLAEITQLPSCELWDISWADHCAWVSTVPNSSDQVSFEFVIAYSVDLPG